ncbi:hypothetical protein MIND_00974000 [Mycena indigotica]|uniref:F-box domain-containing protein n=1 Tax=Mycena indigotica TaxID=2126181 RepID=A0A8H6VX78_9AGAR|nr:uncharacterized protein MIND_00974000 [Mycena indigotica]KAF7297404.1 hypothetical protein MIND_00974000 [Mycena indigotica]
MLNPVRRLMRRFRPTRNAILHDNTGGTASEPGEAKVPKNSSIPPTPTNTSAKAAKRTRLFPPPDSTTEEGPPSIVFHKPISASDLVVNYMDEEEVPEIIERNEGVEARWLKKHAFRGFQRCLCAHRKVLCFCYRLPGTRRRASAINRLPIEILDMILAEALPPNWLLDPSLKCGPDSAWCHAMTMKRSLSLVCKYWYSAMVKFFYRDIAIRRAPQLFCLAQTLARCPDFGNDVHSFTMMCYVLKEDTELVTNALSDIWKKCPKLKQVAQLSPLELPFPYPLPALPVTVERLDIGQFESPELIANLLSKHCSQLRELSVPGLDSELLDLPFAFPHLETLHVLRWNIAGSQLSKFGTQWSMPKLRNLRFAARQFQIPTYDLILRHHGRNLEYLEFPNIYTHQHIRSGGYLEDYQPLLQLCGKLKHVVLPMHHFLGSIPPPHARLSPPEEYLRGIERVDIWHTDIHKEHWFPWESTLGPYNWPFITGKFGDCRQFRFIDVALAAIVEGIPRLIDTDIRGRWSCWGMEILQQHEDSGRGQPRRLALKLGDFPLINEWGNTYFGKLETHAVVRDQEAWNKLGRVRRAEKEVDGPGPLRRGGTVQRFNSLPPVPNDPEDTIPGPYEYTSAEKLAERLKDETDDEDEGELVEEYVADLNDEFYQRT